jgi:5-methylcytosine-specific restriction endonuclease McrA
MIRVSPAPAPDDFHQRVARLGEGALLELTGNSSRPKRRGRPRKDRYESVDDIPVERLPETWTTVLPDMRRRYHDTCAYLAMKIHPATGAATIDHFIPKSKNKHRVYDWSNFRLAVKLVNTYKGEHEDVLDPFRIEDGWFVLNLGNFEVEANPALEPTLQARVRTTAHDRLRLNEPTFCAARQEYHDRYHGLLTYLGGPAEPLPLSWLESECPFVARELRRQGRLRPEDA